MTDALETDIYTTKKTRSWLLIASLLSKSHGTGRSRGIWEADSVFLSLHYWWVGTLRWWSLLYSRNWSLLPIHGYQERTQPCGAIHTTGHEHGEHSHGAPQPMSSEFSSPCTANASGFEKGLGSCLLRTADPQDTLGPSATREAWSWKQIPERERCRKEREMGNFIFWASSQQPSSSITTVITDSSLLAGHKCSMQQAQLMGTANIRDVLWTWLLWNRTQPLRD